jgi:hypothetical protein
MFSTVELTATATSASVYGAVGDVERHAFGPAARHIA